MGSVLDVIELLRQRGADVRYHDPYVPTIQHNGFEMAGEADLDAALRPGFPLPLVGDSLWSQDKPFDKLRTGSWLRRTVWRW